MGTVGFAGGLGGGAGAVPAPAAQDPNALGAGAQFTGTGQWGIGSVPVNPGTNATQLQNAYGQSQNTLASQQQLLAALQGQNGLANQNSVFNQLQGVANGTGPNPAQAQLAQSTAQNVQNQAAMQAGQRGAGANVGLIARQAGQQGAATQQNAAQQAATLQAQQQLGALQGLGNIANTQASNLINTQAGSIQAAQNEQNILQGANTAANQAAVSMQGNINSANAGLAQTQMQGNQGLLGGLLGGVGALGASLLGGGGGGGGAAMGGEIQKYAFGDSVNQAPQAPSLGVNTDLSSGSQVSTPGQFLSAQQNPSGVNSTFNAPQFNMASTSGSQALQKGTQSAVGGLGGMLGSLLNKGGDVGSKLKKGGHVPGKAAVKGDSYKNDTVKALLSPGEVVIPKSVMESKDPTRGAAEFVQAVLAKKRMKAS